VDSADKAAVRARFSAVERRLTSETKENRRDDRDGGAMTKLYVAVSTFQRPGCLPAIR